MTNSKKPIKRRVFAYFFDGYWEDIGTIKSFYEANLNLTSLNPSFDLYNEMAQKPRSDAHLLLKVSTLFRRFEDGRGLK